MKIVFASNYMNHHQRAFCDAMNGNPETEFLFVQTMSMPEDRIALGWQRNAAEQPYVRRYDLDPEGCRTELESADLLILGWTECPELEQWMLGLNKPVLRVSERIYREGQWKFLSPRGLLAKYREHMRYHNKPVYLLCSGAYVASDFHLIRCYEGRRFRWGYFPPCNGRTTRELMADKHHGPWTPENPLRILWTGRMIRLKHPEFALLAAEALRREGIFFELTMAGDGELLPQLREQCGEMGLEDCVTFTGALPVPEVRKAMEAAELFLFTSNYLEGWGAVVNEAMDSGCALVASGEAGAVPFLIRDGENGLIYENGSAEAFVEKCLQLARDPELVPRLGSAAHETIETLWNADRAASELIRCAGEILRGEKPVYAPEGPMSCPEILRPAGWKRTQQEDNHLQ